MRSNVTSWSFGRYGTLWLAIGLLAGFAIALASGVPGNVWAQEAPAEQEPEELETENGVTGFEAMVVQPVEVDLHEDTTVWIYGSGFAPGTHVNLLVADRNGVMSDITAAGSVFPLEANEFGAWATLWTIDRFAHQDVGGESMQSLWAMDGEFNTLATAPIALCAITEREEAAAEPEPEVTPEPAEPPTAPAPGEPTPAPEATPAPGTGGASAQPLLQEEETEEEDVEEVPEFCSR